MIGKLNHVAIAVHDLEAASRLYEEIMGAQVSSPVSLAEHGVRVVFIELPNTKIELLEPLGEKSPIRKFLKKNEDGGIHHICYEVSSIDETVKTLTAAGMTILGDGTPKIGAHGLPVIFLHPKDMNGALVELEEVK